MLNFKIYILGLFLCLGTGISAQLGTSHMQIKDPYSGVLWNPSYKTKAKFHIGLPVLTNMQFTMAHTGFDLADAVDGNRLDVDNVLNTLDRTNHLLMNLRLDLVGFGFKAGDIWFRGGIAERINAGVSYPKGILEMLWKGNGHPDLIGRRIDMDGFAVNFSHVRDYYVGAAATVLSDKLTVGGNLHFLQGLTTVRTSRNRFGLTTDQQDYALLVDGEFEVNISSAYEVNVDTTNASVSQGNEIGFAWTMENKGFELDLGASYKLTEKVTLEASVIGMGRITWNQNPNTVALASTTVRFDGLDLASLIDSTDTAIDNLTDSLTSTLVPTEDKSAFSTTTNTYWNLGAYYNLNESSAVHVSLSNQRIFGTSFWTPRVSYFKDFGSVLRLYGGVEFFGLRQPNINTGLIVKGGAFQFALHTDNIVSAILPDKSSYWNMRIGFNLIFGANELKKIQAD